MLTQHRPTSCEENLMPGKIKMSPEDAYRKLKGYGPDVEVPISLKSDTLPSDQARNLDQTRWAAQEALGEFQDQVGINRGADDARDAAALQRCQDALDFAAARSGNAGLPFDESSKIALQALGTGNPQALRITDEGMKLADDFFQRNPRLLKETTPVPGGTVGKLNFGAGAMSLGYGETINGPRPDPLGALLGNASVMIDSDGKLVGISDEFDYNPNPDNDWLTALGMSVVNDKITRDCPARVSYVPISGGRKF